ncbi:hypothetical protein Z042_03485 [Chania multitudinisentens RB-25]|uniref:Uncharacterized protein n=1 Tax=Chania multitudinisentens RB-25 TaxID=1441930 RepID=W0LJX6_9GAMM|nr:hypothetical protein [Chania multitudinisentens]AHG22637.1 hypothetical protein Z042_03485 [Chania multitudinisentens RB-25]
MKKIKSVIRLLLESGFTRKEIKELQKNSKLFGIDLAFGVKDVGKIMLRTTIIFSVMLLAFLFSLYIKQSFKVVLFFSTFLAILLLISCFFTNIPRYAKSVVFYFKYNKG